MLTGYDVSKYQPSTPALTGHSFLIARATIATTVDSVYATHLANARKAGVVFMAYHYLYGSTEVGIADQVAKFLATAKDADFLWVDQERAGATDADTQAFIDGCRKAGRPCGLYHSASGFGGVNADAKWVADWRAASVAAGHPMNAAGTAEFPGWDLWQYNGGGSDGIDNDYWNPASPLAAFLRRGYVTKAQLDAANTAIAVLTQARDEALADLKACQLAHDADVVKITDLTAQVEDLKIALAGAPAQERERIAQAEAERIRSI